MTTPATIAQSAQLPWRAGPPVTGGLPPEAELVSAYPLTNGDAGDVQGGVNGTVVGTWTSFATGSLVVGDAGTSFYKTGGVAAVTLPANNPLHNLGAMSLSLLYQPSASANKHVIIAWGDGSQPGDGSIERQTDGKLRAWHAGPAGVGLQFFGASTGIVGTNLVLDTAVRITITFGLTGAHLYLDDALVASILSNTNSWNNARIKYVGVWTDGVQSPAQGVFDQISIWSGQLDLSGVQALPAAQNTTYPPATPPTASFPCVARSGGTLNDVRAGDTLTESEVIDLTDGSNVRYDFRGMTKTVALVGGIWPTAGRGLIRLNNGPSHNGACISGGAWRCSNMTADLNWDALYQASNLPRGAFFIRRSTFTNITTIDSVRIHGCFDGLLFGDNTGQTIGPVVIKNCGITLGRDDAIENDNKYAGIDLDNCLIEAFVIYSMRNPDTSNPSGIVTINNCLMRSIPCRITNVPNRTQVNFKLDSTSCKFNLTNNVWAAEGTTFSGDGQLFRDLLDYGRVNISSGNTFCWLGAGSNPHTVPSGTTVLIGSTAQNFWAAAVANWWASFAGTRYSFDPPAP